MKKPIAIIFNDTHLKTGNEAEVYDSINHMVMYAVDNKIDDIIFAGDLFDSRSFQRQEVLLTAKRIMKLFERQNKKLWMFPGNHDKTIYSSHNSFLEIFKYYPNVNFYKEPTQVEIGGKKIDFIPFYSNDMLVPFLENPNVEPGDILVSHFEMNGSSNLGHVIEDSPINRGMLKKWKKVYLGHFHNTMEITKDIVHLPSLRQNNFGEDANKGFSIIYDDLSYEIIKGRFKQFSKIKIDLNETSIREVTELIQTHQGSEDTIRFEFTGDENKLKALDKSQFSGTGIDVKITYDKKFDIENIELPEVTNKHDKASILDNFEKFCEEKGYKVSDGKDMLLEFLNK